MLRALGAPRRVVFATVWAFSAVLLLAGALLGLAVGRGAAGLLSRVLSTRTDIAISALPGWTELHLLAGFVSLALLLSLLPAAVVLRQPVVDGLRSWARPPHSRPFLIIARRAASRYAVPASVPGGLPPGE